MTHAYRTAPLALGALLALAAPAAAEGPRGWFLAGDAPQRYAIGTGPAAPSAGGASGTLRALTPQVKGFGTLMQDFRAAAYHGKRLRFSALVKAEGVGGWAGLWMRVDGASGQSVAFDNMHDRPIKGTQGWRRYEVVLPVAADAAAIALGVLLDGGGQVWIDDVKVEVAGVADARTPARPSLPERPRNLGFEE